MSTEKRQRKALDAVGRLLPPGVSPRAYAAARANARMSPRVTYAIVAFLIVLVVVAVLTGRILIPGVLVFVFFISAIKPLRGIAVTDTTIVVLSTSAVTGKPTTVLGELPHAVLLPPHIHWTRNKVVQVPLGPDVVRLRARDYERPTSSLANAGLAAAGPRHTEPGRTPPEDTHPEDTHPEDTHPAYAPPSTGRAPGWYPMDGDQYRQGYWNGSAWTAMKNWDGTAWVDAEASRH